MASGFLLSGAKWKLAALLVQLSLVQQQVWCFTSVCHHSIKLGCKHGVSSPLGIQPEKRSGQNLRLAKLRMVGDSGSDIWVRPSPRGRKDIVFGAKVVSNIAVSPKHDEGCSLGNYMKLPVDQYVLIPLPNKARLEKKDEHHFALRVPELQIFNVWLRPYVVATVDITEEGVTISAKECKLEGSPEVQRLDLNSKFDFEIKVLLQAREDVRGLRSMIVARSEVYVWVDPPQIFRVMFPKPLMLETGNSVLKTTLNLLQTTFLKGLAQDYNRWAQDQAYRDQRRTGSSKIVHRADSRDNTRHPQQKLQDEQSPNSSQSLSSSPK
ncbi:hypothetical protein GUITHDRAFT_115755 [Guillardia theta CCMP2712]|uniref:Uncharacterized protein n=2 Tax=Guillardia theta TaxID=55529 RepID=L1IQ93_GUITC|nr:hypothetical protein GUITHDRAFT_115755 [Guillardia theta CCMP2712]EKX37995.1 hypothetical protein GUITHDRAFT_115755 [Guillardia theta CCMP2712]|eukprot:XP_005824975.1 hypothetical protein GUITHDRAFT_115755 [Guillardia theta CCMP2712]